jgi:hypothetical protein
MVNNAEYYSDAARDAPLNPLPSNSCIPPLEPGEDTHQLDLMRASRAYFCMDPYLERLRDRGVTKTAEFNAFQGSSVDRWKLLDGWINLENGAKCYLFPKFTCEYVSGRNLWLDGGLDGVVYSRGLDAPRAILPINIIAPQADPSSVDRASTSPSRANATSPQGALSSTSRLVSGVYFASLP